LIAKEIQRKIVEKTRLSASAGISVNKFLAKIASDYKKPNGFFVIPPEDVESFVEQLPIDRFYGVGKVTVQKMYENQIFTGYDLKQRSEGELVRLFGKQGHSLYLYARGIDKREVEPNHITKSISSETTFLQDKSEQTLLTVELYHLAKEVAERMKKENFYGRTLTIKVKYADFQIITRSKTLSQKMTNFQQFWPIAREMMKQIDWEKPVRLLGFGISHAGGETQTKKYTQLELKLF